VPTRHSHGHALAHGKDVRAVLRRRLASARVTPDLVAEAVGRGRNLTGDLLGSGGKALEGPVESCEATSPASSDERVRAAWHAWLSALATDAEAALSAALSYEALDDTGRNLWLDALDQDAPHIAAPKVALYAPLLSVENEPERRARIQAAVG